MIQNLKIDRNFNEKAIGLRETSHKIQRVPIQGIDYSQ